MVNPDHKAWENARLEVKRRWKIRRFLRRPANGSSLLAVAYFLLGSVFGPAIGSFVQWVFNIAVPEQTIDISQNDTASKIVINLSNGYSSFFFRSQELLSTMMLYRNGAETKEAWRKFIDAFDFALSNKILAQRIIESQFGPVKANKFKEDWNKIVQEKKDITDIYNNLSLKNDLDVTAVKDHSATIDTIDKNYYVFISCILDIGGTFKINASSAECKVLNEN